MDWKRIEKSSDVALRGIRATVTRENGSICEVVLEDEAGTKLRMACMYGLNVFTPAKPETRTVSVIEGVIAEAPVSVTVEAKASDYETMSRKADLESHGVENITVREVSEDIPF